MKPKSNLRNLILLLCFFVAALLASNAAGRDPAPEGNPVMVDGFLKVGTWWELDFEKENNPLKKGSLSVRTIQVVGRDESRPSGIEIRDPADMKELLKAHAEKAAGNPGKITTDEIEEIVTEWSRQWINLRFVVSAKLYHP